MLWFALCLLAIACLQWAKRLHLLDEIYALALYSTGSLAALWGLRSPPAKPRLALAS
ncbi:MAG: hypothetical protein HC770_07605 [Pseudanabaena sp. CRU_2_10]|nr:hypothetical protein [Pseudanabaena sp. CRU_2_10]